MTRRMPSVLVLSVLWRCWLGGMKGIQPVKNWVVGCWHGYPSETRCRFAYGPGDATAIHYLLLQLIQIGFTRMVLLFWCRLTQVVREERPLNKCSSRRMLQIDYHTCTSILQGGCSSWYLTINVRALHAIFRRDKNLNGQVVFCYESLHYLVKYMTPFRLAVINSCFVSDTLLTRKCKQSYRPADPYASSSTSHNLVTRTFLTRRQCMPTACHALCVHQV